MDDLVFDVRNVANFLKVIVNKNCEDGFVWYKNIGDMPNLMEVNMAICILEGITDKEATVALRDALKEGRLF